MIIHTVKIEQTGHIELGLNLLVVFTFNYLLILHNLTTQCISFSMFFVAISFLVTQYRTSFKIFILFDTVILYTK
jgi:hypothetical protein